MNQSIFQKKEFLVAVGFAVVNLVILGFGIWFLTAKIAFTSSQLKERKSALADLYQGWQQMSREQKELQKIEPQLAKLNQAFISGEHPLAFINLVEVLAQKTNNLFEINLIPGPQDSEKEEAGALFFQISLAGSFSNFMHFLRYLENMEYYTEVTTLQVSQITGQNIVQKPEWGQIPAGSVFSIINLKVLTQ